MNKKIPALLSAISFFAIQTATAQLNISGAQFVIESGAEVNIQGDLTSTTDILGPGKIILNGTITQNVNTGGFTIPNLELDNNANALLTGNTRIGKSLLFTNGKIVAGDFNLNLADSAAASGMGTGKFVETNGTGQVIKELTANVTSVEIPVGAGTGYRPAFVTTAGTYSSAMVGLRVLPSANPNAPPSLSDYIKAYWPVTRTGITGTVRVAGQYIDADINADGRKDSLRGYYYNGADWSSATETHNASTNRVSASIAANGTLSGMDKFDLVKTKAFLQGAYLGSGLMSDNLRTSGTPGTSLIPLSDPYRTAPYNSTFTQVVNLITETAAASVFTDKASSNDNIVDWVFLELRNNASPGNSVLQSRSALLQRDGDIVDVDGLSPVTFNNIASGTYTVVVRHRNHLGIGTDPLAFTHSFAEAKSTAPLVDFTVATDLQIFGTSTAFKINSADGKVLLWAGDADFNGKVKYGGSTNDPNTIQTQVLTFAGNTAGSYTYNNAIGYFSGDINMDRRVKFAGGTNDVNGILTNVINYPSNTSGSYTYSAFNQQLPN